MMRYVAAVLLLAWSTAIAQPEEIVPVRKSELMELLQRYEAMQREVVRLEVMVETLRIKLGCA